MHTDLSTGWFIVIIVLVIWELIWKALALWRAGQQKQMVWFIILILVNTVGILPIIYLLTHPRGNVGGHHDSE